MSVTLHLQQTVHTYTHTGTLHWAISDTQQSMEFAMHILVMSSYELIGVRLAPPNLCCLDKQQIGDKYVVPVIVA